MLSVKVKAVVKYLLVHCYHVQRELWEHEQNHVFTIATLSTSQYILQYDIKISQPLWS